MFHSLSASTKVQIGILTTLVRLTGAYPGGGRDAAWWRSTKRQASMPDQVSLSVAEGVGTAGVGCGSAWG